ncbi:hypothetical protein KZX45_12085 [Georgenia sp. EYE_87]|uniref:variant leucine-rich repeat-containing protein n=1 Tax=Georgenia sp. EYE_87 TaxID=2853448 RepID=UPI00200439C1|nr:hypothetical protein [Georgenia sp. EYE_87]MCK6211283.1 hypothetical protein [Georgenia sp. EYE_87]
MDGENDLRRQAANPGTPLTTLQQLAQHHPELRATIAENPSTYPALLDWLGRLRMPEVDAALARRAASAAAPTAPAAPATPPVEARGAEPESDTSPTAAMPPVTHARAAAPAGADVPASGTEPTAVRPAAAEDTAAVGGQQTQAMPAVPAAEAGQQTQAMPTVPATEAGPRAGDGAPFDPDATAVYSDPDVPARDAAEPPTFAPAQPVERPAVAEPTDSPTEAMPRIVPAWTPARAGRPGRTTHPGGPDRAAPVRDRHATAGTGAAAGAPAAAARTDEHGRRSWLPLTILAAVALALVLLVVWQLSGGEDEERPTPAATTAGEAQPTASASPTPTPTATDDAQAARDALVALPESSACTDPVADASAFAAFATSAAPDGAWADPASGELVMTTLDQLQDSCDNVHAVAVASAITGDDAAPEALRTTVTEAGTGWVDLARAAPPGAQERSSFASPSQNITCDLADSARCTIDDYDFAPPEGCSGPTTLAVPRDGEAAPDCGQPAAAGNGVLEYGQSATAGFFACTSEQSGMTCWSTLTGRGFAVARAGFQTF